MDESVDRLLKDVNDLFGITRLKKLRTSMLILSVVVLAAVVVIGGFIVASLPYAPPELYICETALAASALLLLFAQYAVNRRLVAALHEAKLFVEHSCKRDGTD